MSLRAIVRTSLFAVGICAAAPADQHKLLLDKYCVTCHNQKLKTGNLALDRADITRPGDDAGTWERVVRKLKNGQMPPAGLPRPTDAESRATANYLLTSLETAAAAHPNPGRTSAHRLNRAEYSNAIRDILALDIKPGSALPVDDSGYGFDNMADLLTMSPALLERYLSVAGKVARAAVGDPALKPTEETFVITKRGKAARNERASDDLPFASRGGGIVNYYFPVDAEYGFKVTLTGGNAKPLLFKTAIKAGLHAVGATFLRDSTRAEMAAPGRRGVITPGAGPNIIDLRLDGTRLKRFETTDGGGLPEIDSIAIDGPYNVTGRGETASRTRIFTCRPEPGKDETACARTILTQIAHRAFRRPVTDSDIRPLLGFFTSGRAEGDFDHGIEKALRAVLISPDFLFRVEQDPPGVARGVAYKLSPLEIASRLSFFLWSSVPDDLLLKVAEDGSLALPAVLNRQVRRMLDDPRSDQLISNFGGQWLYLRNLETVKPDPDVFNDFDDALRQSFRRETEMFLASVFREDLSLMTLLDSNYTFLNQRLADHYGVPGIYGSQFRRVTVTDPNRRGLLGQGSILTVTSYPNRTSVVQRGKWILENFLGSPPPPPPPDVPELKPHAQDGRQRTLREAMEEHRANAICAGCHARMDPIGFALENYNGIGKWRDNEGGAKIDSSGQLPGGARFDGPAGLRHLLVTAYPEDFAGTFTEKLLTYALGRGLEPYDKPAVRSIVRQAGRDGYRISTFVNAIVQSTPFQMRRAPQK